MKLLTLAALTCALVAPLAGTASAETATYPIKSSKLTANPLYKAGPLPTTVCEEPPVKRNDRKLARAYLDAVISCLETTWGQHLVNAGLPYKPVKVRHVNRIPKNHCGFEPTKDDSQAWYCERNGTLFFQLGDGWLDDPSDLWLFETAASMYAFHVQQLAGIYPAYDALKSGKKAEGYEQERRLSLQAECFAGAYVKSVWPMENRKSSDWNYFLRILQGDQAGDKPTYGKSATIRAWIKRGFATGDPGSCNTWAAPSSQVR
ncbi:neutral zinc metallopeptidase [Nonomuraea zeae]|uniref:neutral zinc metallopeptidase n=1 Tax=Nonomuraea zeae TaxID=1642303 RepID=UPI001478C4FE|nr:neutral zinc metallopeptidase [Nonomuraea zeae]